MKGITAEITEKGETEPCISNFQVIKRADTTQTRSKTYIIKGESRCFGSSASVCTVISPVDLQNTVTSVGVTG